VKMTLRHQAIKGAAPCLAFPPLKFHSFISYVSNHHIHELESMPPQDSMQQPYQLNRVLYYYILLPWSTTQAFAPDQRKLLGALRRRRACTVPAGVAQLIYCPAPAEMIRMTRGIWIWGRMHACVRACVPLSCANHLSVRFLRHQILKTNKHQEIEQSLLLPVFFYH
jgi:hypothetical protein